MPKVPSWPPNATGPKRNSRRGGDRRRRNARRSLHSGNHEELARDASTLKAGHTRGRAGEPSTFSPRAREGADPGRSTRFAGSASESTGGDDDVLSPDSVLRRVAVSGGHASQDPRLTAEIRSWGAGDACLGPNRTSPPGAKCSEARRIGGRVDPTERRAPRTGKPSPEKERRQPSPRVEKHPEPTRTFQERGDQGGRQTSRYRRISPAGRTHPPIQVMGHLKPAEQGLDATKASENLMPAARETTPRDLALNQPPVALKDRPKASSPLHLVVATRKVPHFGILSRIEWNSSRKRIPRPEEFSSTPSGCGRMSTGRRPTTGCGQTVETC